MHICDICYTVIEGEEELCDKCRNRRPAKELKEEKLSDEEIIERFKELMTLREENIELLIEKLRRKSVKYEII